MNKQVIMRKQRNFRQFIGLLISGIALCSPSAANSGQHQHHSKSGAESVCKNSSEQKCAKTMSSVFDNQGRLWSTWSDKEFIYVNYSDDNGISFSKAVRVNQIGEKIAARNEHRPKIKIGKNRTVLLSWTTKLNKRFTGNIRFSRSTDLGATFSQPVTVNDNHDIISHRFDAMAVNTAGDIYISWLDKRDQLVAKQAGKKYHGAAAYYAVSTDNGSSFKANKKIADHSCECCRMAIDIDRNDLPVISWRHIYGKNIRDHAITSFVTQNQPAKPFRLSNDHWKINGCPHHGPSLSIDKKNRYHAVWFNNAEKNHGIFYAHSDDNGKTFSQQIPVGDYDKRASHADIKVTGNKLFITWKEQHDTHSVIYLMTSKNMGDSWNKPSIIARSSKSADYPFIINKNNKAFISWHIPGSAYRLIPISE